MALGKYAEEIAERILENEERRALWEGQMYTSRAETEKEKETRYYTTEPKRYMRKRPM